MTPKPWSTKGKIHKLETSSKYICSAKDPLKMNKTSYRVQENTADHIDNKGLSIWNIQNSKTQTSIGKKIEQKTNNSIENWQKT